MHPGFVWFAVGCRCRRWLEGLRVDHRRSGGQQGKDIAPQRRWPSFERDFRWCRNGPFSAVIHPGCDEDQGRALSGAEAPRTSATRLAGRATRALCEARSGSSKKIRPLLREAVESDLGLAQGQQRIFEEDPPAVRRGGDALSQDRFEWHEPLHHRFQPWVDGRLGGFVRGWDHLRHTWQQRQEAVMPRRQSRWCERHEARTNRFLGVHRLSGAF